MKGTYEISTDTACFDVDLIHEFLSTTYWAQGRPRELVERSIRNSLCFGAFEGARQVGFARVITDRAVFGYLADVFVVPATRGSIFDPAAEPLEGHYPHRLVGKIGIDATAKPRHDVKDFDRPWPKNWGKVKLADYL